MNRELVSYTYDFASYLLGLSFLDNFSLQRIILYGSIVRGEVLESSDIDLFFDIKGSQKDIEALKNKIRKAADLFYVSDRVKKWELKGVANKFSVIVGNIEEKQWTDLRDSISTYGITLWERFQFQPSGELQRHMLFSWVSHGAAIRDRVNLCRRMYGYSIGKSHYPGLLGRINGQRIGDGIILVPAEYSNEVRKVLRDLKIKYKMREIFMQ